MYNSKETWPVTFMRGQMPSISDMSDFQSLQIQVFCVREHSGIEGNRVGSRGKNEDTSLKQAHRTHAAMLQHTQPRPTAVYNNAANTTYPPLDFVPAPAASRVSDAAAAALPSPTATPAPPTPPTPPASPAVATQGRTEKRARECTYSQLLPEPGSVSPCESFKEFRYATFAGERCCTLLCRHDIRERREKHEEGQDLK